MVRVQSVNTIRDLGFNKFNRRDIALDSFNNLNRVNDINTTGQIPLSEINHVVPEKSIDLNKTTIDTFRVNQWIKGGADGYDLGTGWWIGMDGATPKLFIGDSDGDKVTWDGTTLNVSGSLIAGNIHIPDKDTTENSMHVEADGDTWWGCTQSDWDTNNDNATAWIKKNGDAKFQNVFVRGLLSSSVFEKSTVNAVGGNLIISDSDVLDVDMTALDASTLTTKEITIPNNTIVRLKDGSDDEWIKIVSSTGTEHTVTRDLAGSYASDSNPAWKEGTAVVSFAKADEGFIELDGSGTNAPFIKTYKRNSDTYDDYDVKCIMGNLKDKTGTEEQGFWAEGSSLYLGGYKQYDIIATKEGTGGATKVFYEGSSYSSIKAALDAAQTASETEVTMFIRVGTYTENENTTGWDMDINIIGEEKGSTIISFDTSQEYWKFNDNISISNVSFTANVSSNALIYADGGDLVFINNCNITNEYSATDGAGGIRLGAVADATNTKTVISNCNITCASAATDSPSSTYAGIAVTGDRGYVQILRNNLLLSGYGIYFAGTSNHVRNIVSQNQIGMYTDSVKTRGSAIYVNSTGFIQSLIEGNNIYEESGSGYFEKGIYINGSASVIQHNRVVNNFVIAATNGLELESGGIVCSGNQVQGCDDHGILVKGGNASANNINNIVNNSVYNCGNDGISIEVSNFNIIGNSIYDCDIGIGDSETTAIHDNITCVGNQLRDCNNGILIQNSNGSFASENFIFSDNYISGGDSQTTGIGIGIGTALSNVIIKGNIIQYFDEGIGFSQRYGGRCEGIKIEGNDIREMNSAAINFDGYGVAYLQILNNNVYDGIVLESLGTGIIKDNVIFGSNGISIDQNMSNSEISGNYIDVSTNNGILVSGSISDGSRIANNYIDTQNATAVGIKVDDDMYNCIITGNRIDSEITGIRVADEVDDSVIANNWIQYDGSGYGIQIVGDVDTSGSDNQGSVFSGNRIQHDDTTGSTECIYIGGNVRNLTVTGNRLYGGGSGNYVIMIVGTSAYCLFTGNRNSDGLSAGSIGAGIQGTGARTSNTQANNLMT